MANKKRIMASTSVSPWPARSLPQTARRRQSSCAHRRSLARTLRRTTAQKKRGGERPINTQETAHQARPDTASGSSGDIKVLARAVHTGREGELILSFHYPWSDKKQKQSPPVTVVLFCFFSSHFCYCRPPSSTRYDKLDDPTGVTQEGGSFGMQTNPQPHTREPQT